MTPSPDSIDCSFCQKFGDFMKPAQSPTRWYDEALSETTHFKALAAIGAFSPGYMMIVTKGHLASMASIPDSWCDEFLEFRAGIAEVLHGLYGPVSIFEHANQQVAISSGSCIDHAHIHLCPTVPGLADRFASAFAVITADNFLAAREKLKDRSYVYLEELGDAPRVAILTNPIPSQTIRRLIAADRGIPDEWDWAVSPNLHHVAATIAGVRAVLKS